MFRTYLLTLLIPLTLSAACTQGNRQAIAAQETRQVTSLGNSASTNDNLSKLSDEFISSETLSSWRHVYKEEGWGANQLEGFDIGKTQSGWMMMMPFTSSWYQDYRGIMAFKPVQGDFVVTTHLRVNRRNGSGAPRSQFSLAGIMIRAPRNITPQTWRPGGENYIFLSLGAADTPDQYQFEVKTTVNSDSQLRIVPANAGEATIRVARIGSQFILMRNTGSGWTIHQRYNRPDLPANLQVGLTCYTDWPNVSKLSPFDQNRTVIRNGNPDLVALYDYVRYRRPTVPANLAGKRLDDPGKVSDQELLRFLGD